MTRRPEDQCPFVIIDPPSPTMERTSSLNRPPSFEPPSPKSLFRWLVWTYNGPPQRRLYGRICAARAAIDAVRTGYPSDAAIADGHLELADHRLARGVTWMSPGGIYRRDTGLNCRFTYPGDLAVPFDAIARAV